MGSGLDKISQMKFQSTKAKLNQQCDMKFKIYPERARSTPYIMCLKGFRVPIYGDFFVVLYLSQHMLAKFQLVSNIFRVKMLNDRAIYIIEESQTF